MTVELDDEPSIRDLIERLRTLGESPRPLDQLYTGAVDKALNDRLNALSDRQIGQLLFDFCWVECYVNSPELIIVTQAIDRLRRSTAGAVTNEEAQENLKQQPACPICGNEMFLHYGIDEPDFWRCDHVACRHKRYVGEQQTPDESPGVAQADSDLPNFRFADHRVRGFRTKRIARVEARNQDLRYGSLQASGNFELV